MDGAPIQEGLPRHIVDRIQFEAHLDHEDVKALDQIQLIDFSSCMYESITGRFFAHEHSFLCLKPPSVYSYSFPIFSSGKDLR